MGAEVKKWELRPDLDGNTWHSNIDELEEMVGPGPR